MAHVNLMTDTVIANLPPDALRTILRDILVSNPEVTSTLEQRAKTYLQRNTEIELEVSSPPDIENLVALSRVMLGCGMWAQSLQLIQNILSNAPQTFISSRHKADNILSSLDGDLIQAITAIEKTQLGRRLSDEEVHIINGLYEALHTYKHSQLAEHKESEFDRSLKSMSRLLGRPIELSEPLPSASTNIDHSTVDSPHNIETFGLGNWMLPRLFTGLWQLSSPSWGVASQSQVLKQFHRYADSGFTAYDMADHYGDAEILFGDFKSHYGQSDKLFASTKLCVFQSVEVTPQYIQEKVDERCRRLSSDAVDLLQFHWQFYDDAQYVQALRLLQEDSRVSLLGLCNFDTKRMEEILSAGIRIVSNQVQFSLIDARPMVRMGSVCQDNNVKLLTYGTLCGGFIAKKWLGKPEPELYSSGITPSQRKYFEMIKIWGGWKLFQDLLKTLQAIAVRHNVSISNVATRWVLDFPYVGAVIIGARMGVAEHIGDNLNVYGWKLDAQDHGAINEILNRSRRNDVYEQLGDCGGEYRL